MGEQRHGHTHIPHIPLMHAGRDAGTHNTHRYHSARPRNPPNSPPYYSPPQPASGLRSPAHGPPARALHHPLHTQFQAGRGSSTTAPLPLIHATQHDRQQPNPWGSSAPYARQARQCTGTPPHTSRQHEQAVSRQRACPFGFSRKGFHFFGVETPRPRGCGDAPLIPGGQDAGAGPGAAEAKAEAGKTVPSFPASTPQMYLGSRCGE